MHDFFEGVCLYDLRNILLNLIDGGCFSLEVFNAQLKPFPFYGPTSFFNPFYPISREIRVAKSFKMSASEIALFVRFLSVMIGDLVPRRNAYWELYIVPRQILDLILSPVLSQKTVLNCNQMCVITTACTPNFSTIR